MAATQRYPKVIHAVTHFFACFELLLSKMSGGCTRDRPEQNPDLNVAYVMFVVLGCAAFGGRIGAQVQLPASGKISTLAGTGTQGCTGNGNAATSAKLSQAMGVKVDAAGNIYFADYTCATVSKIVASSGNIATVAGNDHEGSGADHRRSHDLAGNRARPARGPQWNAAEDKRERGHQDRAQAQLRPFKSRIRERFSVLVLILGELDDQNRVLRGQADQHDQANL